MNTPKWWKVHGKGRFCYSCGQTKSRCPNTQELFVHQEMFYWVITKFDIYKGIFTTFLRIFENDFWWPRDASLSVGQVWYIIDMTFFQNIFAYFCKWFLVTKCLSAPEDCAQMQNPKCNSDTTLLSVFCHSFEIRIYHFIIVIDTHLMINHDSDFQK